MKKRSLVLALLLSFVIAISLSGCSHNSTFSVLFINVGEGDSALIECDGHYMLIDGGPITKSRSDNRVYQTLKDKDIQHLDILVISHLHEDHYGGLIHALAYATKIGRTICNSEKSPNGSFGELEHQLSINGTRIQVANTGDKFKLGSAEIEVVDSSSSDDNDSLVIMITYGKTRFLFTGDIEEKAQARISNKYETANDEEYKVNLIKIPHHGAYENTLYRFIRTFMPTYAVISVGRNNYDHPRPETLQILEEAGSKVFRTDIDGDILVQSDGTQLSFKTLG